jgi:hypothetical protein
MRRLALLPALLPWRRWRNRRRLAGMAMAMPTLGRETHLCGTYVLVFCFIAGEPSS